MTIKNHHANPKKPKRIGGLLGLFAAASLTLLLVWLHISGLLGGVDMFNFLPKDEEGAASLAVGPVRLGQTVGAVKKAHPSMTVTALASGGVLGRFVVSGATYTVAFLGPDQGGHGIDINAP